MGSKATRKISALFEFHPNGRLKGVLWNAESEKDQVILQRGLSRLLKPQKFDLLKKLFRRG